MPNWCENRITFDRDVEDNFQLIDAFRTAKPFQLIRPCPQDLLSEEAHRWGGENKEAQDALRAQLRATYGYGNAYDWHISKWGTKWDACDITQEGDNEFAFLTAWSPPTTLYEYISRNHPGARFDFWFEEGGCQFAGEGYVRDGDFRYGDIPGSWEEPLFEEPQPIATTGSVVLGSETRPKLP